MSFFTINRNWNVVTPPKELGSTLLRKLNLENMGAIK